MRVKPPKNRDRRREWSWGQARKRLVLLSDCSESNLRRNPMQRLVCYVRRITDAFLTHQCSLMACACAYCAILSLLPLLIVGIAVLGFVVGGSNEALDVVIKSIRSYVPINPIFLHETLHHVLQDRHVIGFFGITGLIYAAHLTFLSMQPAMNMIWVVAETRHWVRQRLIALGATFLTILLLGADFAASTAVALVFQLNLPLISGRVEQMLLRIGLAAIPVLIMSLLFALLYQMLPSRSVPFKSCAVGACVAAILWELTKVAFGAFLIYSHSYDRLYGSVSSVVVLIVWVYYSMTILLLGAEITADYEFMRQSRKAARERSLSSSDLAVAHGTHREDSLLNRQEAIHKELIQHQEQLQHQDADAEQSGDAKSAEQESLESKEP